MFWLDPLPGIILHILQAVSDRPYHSVRSSITALGLYVLFTENVRLVIIEFLNTITHYFISFSRINELMIYVLAKNTIMNARYSAGIDFRRQILTSKVDSRTVRVKVFIMVTYGFK